MAVFIRLDSYVMCFTLQVDATELGVPSGKHLPLKLAEILYLPTVISLEKCR